MKTPIWAVALVLLAGASYAAPGPVKPPTDPLTAGEQRWKATASTMVAALDAGRADEVWAKYLAKARRTDTPQAKFKQMVQQVNSSIGPVESAVLLTKVERPLGGIVGLPDNDVVKKEELTYKDKYFDTVWDLRGKRETHTFLLMTLVAENHEPRILWLEYQGQGIKTSEYRQVEQPMKTRALQFIGKLLKDERVDIVDHELSAQFRRRLPRDHVMSMLDDVRHHIGAVGGVGYFSGWVQHQPPGVTVAFRQKDISSGKKPYEVLIRLVDEGGQYKVDAIGDEWETGKKKI